MGVAQEIRYPLKDLPAFPEIGSDYTTSQWLFPRKERPLTLEVIYRYLRNAVLALAWFIVLPLLLLCICQPVEGAQLQRVSLIIRGLAGMPEYEESFSGWTSKLELMLSAQADHRVVVLDGSTQKREEILGTVSEVLSLLPSEGDLWVFLVGHGSYDGRDFKFNISGPDITGDDLAKILDRGEKGRTFLIAGTSASGILIPKLRGENRVIVTATKNQFERQPPLFLSFLVEAGTTPEADRDKNGKVSLLEAFLFSRRKVKDWFQEKGRIQTEHALLDDSSRIRLGEDKQDVTDQVRTGTGLLAGVAYLSSPQEELLASPDARALVRRRSQLEREIDDLKLNKQEFPEDVYYERLQVLLLELADVGERIDALEGGQ